jgi:hypothetical protein
VTDSRPIVVATATEPPAIGAWDELVTSGGAPLFYRSDVLRAYHRFPLREVLRAYYLTVSRKGTEIPLAVLPVYLQPAEDPLHVLAAMLPGFEPQGPPLLLSHVWHWYDTHIPARGLSAEMLDAVCAELRGLAAGIGAQGFGFMNVAEGTALAATLRASGRELMPIDARHTMSLRGFGDLDDYLATVPSHARQDLRRNRRLAVRDGAEVSVETPDRATMTEVSRLCDATSAKHGNHGWYRQRRLTDFVCELADHVRLVTIRRGRQVLAASISFVDRRRFHNWAAGSLPFTDMAFSPYMVLLEATVSAAIDSGCDLLEGGRRNDAWKRRFGFTRLPLLGWAQRL